MNSHALAAPAVRLLGSVLLAALIAPAFAADILEARYNAAREDYRASARISLDEIPCRPAIVTLRLGRTAHTDVFVPPLPES